jgi:hypothetical protein
MKIVVLDSAKQHLIEGFSFYEPQSLGLGTQPSHRNDVAG